MATLEKIRSKSVLLFTIIIVALLAFILGDFLTSGRTFFSDPTTLAEVDGKKINIQEFESRVQQITESNKDANIAEVHQYVLEQMINELLIKEEIEKLGIVVTSQELTNAMTGANALPMVIQQVQQMGMENPAQLYDLAYNPAKLGIDPNNEQMMVLSQNAKAAWKTLEQNVTDMLLQQKYYSLFAGTLTANKLDAKALYNDQATTSKIIYAKKDYSSLSDDQFKVTDEEISALYDQHKNRFLVNETPSVLIDYIAVSITPSAADRTAARTEVNNAIAALKAKPGIEGLEGNVNIIPSRVKGPKDNVDAALKDTLDKMQINDVIDLSRGDNHKIAKLLAKTTDTITAKWDALSFMGEPAKIDSVVNLLNAGTTIDTLIAQGLIAKNPNTPAEFSLYDTNVDENTKKIVLGAQVGKFFSPDSTNAIIRVNELVNGNVYEYAIAEYNVEPSAQTIAKIKKDLSDYAGKNNNPEAFAKNAAAAGYTVNSANLTSSSTGIPAAFGRSLIPSTRKGVNWAMEADKGTVSPMFSDEDNTRVYAIAVKEIYKGDYIPASDPDVKKYLEGIAVRDKKAAKLMGDYKNMKSLEEIAAAMGSSIDSTQVTFSNPAIAGLGMEPVVNGNVAVAASGKLVGPLKGENSVIAIKVLSQDKSNTPYDQKTFENQYNRTFSGVLSNGLPMILREKADVENRIQKFYRN